ncbi:ABC transporter substrate-binding protein [Cereibacter sp. SYSU M97828]|nr:ABC transporter substrate-binding protein [Cereibacter flavus]
MSKTTSMMLAAMACATVTAPARANELFVAGYGGIYETTMAEKIVPAFEDTHGVTVQYVAGQSTATLAKIQASRGSGEIDVAIIDDGPMYQAVQYDFCVPLAEATVYDDFYPIARFDDSALGLSIGSTGFVYNTEIFAEKGWAAPTSWKDLEDPKFKGQLAMLGASSTTGVHGLVMVARANGGGEADIEPGFAAFVERIRPNILTFAPSAPKLEELLQSREIALTVLSESRAAGLKRAGMPVEFVTPAEGSPVLMNSTCVVKDTDQPELAQQFVQYLASAEVQKILADAGYAPVNRTVELTEEQRASMPSEDAIAGMLTLDWPKINEQRADWLNRWNREIER